jgi:hypothetical protein
VNRDYEYQAHGIMYGIDGPMRADDDLADYFGVFFVRDPDGPILHCPEYGTFPSRAECEEFCDELNREP